MQLVYNFSASCLLDVKYLDISPITSLYDFKTLQNICLFRCWQSLTKVIVSTYTRPIIREIAILGTLVEVISMRKTRFKY